MLCDTLREVCSAVSGAAGGTGTAVVRKHTERLRELGDMSVVWAGAGAGPENAEWAARLRQESQRWRLPLAEAALRQERLVLWLERPAACACAAEQSAANATAIEKALAQRSSVAVEVAATSREDDLTEARARIVGEVIRRLAASTGLSKRFVVTTKSSTEETTGSKLILCGAVLNANTGSKETTITASEYIWKRQNEMNLIAQHKYGVRISSNNQWKEFLSQLGESAVVFELLQTKPNSAVRIDFDNPANGCSKGASFILYNCARLETLVRTFKEKVDCGEYPPAPDIQSTDFSLLSDEDEWNLMYKYVLGFPSVLQSCLNVSGEYCHVAPHHLCTFLSSMVRTFSQYYRRVRILTEPRQHLLPVMFARIHLLMALSSTLNTSLKILKIPAVRHM